MNIRPAMIADAREIAKVHVKSWQTTYRGIVSEDYLTSLNPEESAARWEKHLRSDSVTYVAETPEKKIAGFICGGKIRSQQPVQTGEVYALYLLQEVQRQQLGTRLMRQLAESLQKQGCNSLVVYVIKDNPARRFYEKLGAIPVNSETSWIGDQEVEEIRYEWVSLDSLLKKAEQSTTHQ